jgi:hypothetical protein
MLTGFAGVSTQGLNRAVAVAVAVAEEALNMSHTMVMNGGMKIYMFMLPYIGMLLLRHRPRRRLAAVVAAVAATAATASRGSGGIGG